MTPENKEELNKASAEKVQMQICWDQTVQLQQERGG